MRRNRLIEKQQTLVFQLPDYLILAITNRCGLKAVIRDQQTEPAAFLPPVLSFEPASSLQGHGLKEESHQSSATDCREGLHEHRRSNSGDGSIFECLHTCIFSTQSSNS